MGRSVTFLVAGRIMGTSRPLPALLRVGREGEEGADDDKGGDSPSPAQAGQARARDRHGPGQHMAARPGRP